MVPRYRAKRGDLFLLFQSAHKPAGSPGAQGTRWCLTPPAPGNACRWKPPCLPPPPAHRHHFRWVGPRYKYVGNIQFCPSPFGEGSDAERARAAHHPVAPHCSAWPASPGTPSRCPYSTARCLFGGVSCSVRRAAGQAPGPVEARLAAHVPGPPAGSISCKRMD